LRSTLIINDTLTSENVIIAEVSKPSEVRPVLFGSINLVLFDAFDKIKKLNDSLFHFEECTKVAHNSDEKVVDVLRDSTIYVSIY